MLVTMQSLINCNRRIFLAFSLILFLGYSAQGVPVQKARYKWVRCNPDGNSANCIEEKGPLFEIRDGDANKILPPRTDPYLTKKLQDLNEIFPLSEDEESGSGNDFSSGMEPEPGSGVEYFEPLALKLPSDKQDFGQELTEENFIL
ncbi:serglycin [Ornithorhynchus anatinus]|uniref:Serglycin n=1 Tax=Ornithorhynchus anatinus TaxID=9258 RepID=A0A6I8PM18_ORNAN|nr:serglycin [Ornithorhynchus anatinus]